MAADGVAMLHVDTEGFEAAGRSDAYDDRIFALASVLASVLVYNLPEAVRESDVEKLGFATQVADALFRGRGGEGGDAASPPIRPASMLWLIQRDFLGGDSAQQALDAALAPVPNPGADAGVARLNRVRESIAAIAATSVAASLPQPHLDRTKLCELGDESLAPEYLAARTELRARIASLAAPKTVRGAALDGPGLADLVERMVAALNARDIPSAGSILEAFNRDAARRAGDAVTAALASLTLPVDDDSLKTAADAAAASALASFDGERFGGDGPAAAAESAALATSLAAIAATARDKNELASTRACAGLATAAEDALEAEQRAALPSAARFERRYAAARASFDAGCVGPAAPDAMARLDKAADRERARFLADLDDRIFTGVVYASVALIALSRFVVRWAPLELLAWAAFAFLQLYPKGKAFGGASMYSTGWWHSVVRTWEAAVRYPPLLAAVGGVAAALAAARVRSRCRGRRAARARGRPTGKPAREPRGRAAAWILGGGARRRGGGGERDLDV
jgi:hypothetical protein